MNDEYYIKFSDKTKPALVIPPNEVNNDTTLTLFGRNTVGWGAMFGESMLALLENACNYYPPGWAKQVLPGQLWYSTKDNTLKLCTNSNPLTWTNIANADPIVLTNVVDTTNIEQLTSNYILQTGNSTRMTGELLLASVTKDTPFYYLATKAYVHNVSNKFLRRKKTTENLRLTGDVVKTIIHLPDAFNPITFSVDNCATKGYIDNLPNSISQSIQTTTATCSTGGAIIDCKVSQTKLANSDIVNISGLLTFKSGYGKCILTLPISYAGLYYCLISGGIRPIDATNDVSSDIIFSIRSQNQIVLRRKTTNINEEVYFIITGQYNSSAKTTIDENIILGTSVATGTDYTTYNEITAVLDSNGLPLSEIKYEWYKATDLLNEVANTANYTPTTSGNYIATATFVAGNDYTYTISSETIPVALSANRAGQVTIKYSLSATKPYKPVLTAEIQDADVPITPISYQWLYKPDKVSNFYVLQNETNSSIKPTAPGLYSITVVYQDGTGANNTIGVDSVIPYELNPLSFDVPGEVTITGFNGINFPLTATLTDLNRVEPSAAPITYAWYKAGLMTASVSTSQTYTPLSKGKYVCIITYTDSISAGQTATSNEFEVFLTPTNIPGAVTISGGTFINTELSATLEDANITTTSGVVNWQWYIVKDSGGSRPVPIISATQSNYTPRSPGFYVAEATYNDAVHLGTNTEVAKSTPYEITIKYEGSAGVIKLTGKTQQFSEITATLTDPDTDLSGFVWIWRLKDQDGIYQPQSGVSGSTSNPCTFTPDTVGAYRVYVEYNDAYHLDANITRAQLDVDITQLDHDGVILVANTIPDTAPDSTALLSPLVGETLVAAIQDTDVPDPTKPIKYQWYLNDVLTTPIVQSDTFKPTTSGNYYVKCTYTDKIGTHVVIQKVIVGDVATELKIGQELEGGYYGGDFYDNGLIFHIIVAPKSTEKTNISINDLYIDTGVSTTIEGSTLSSSVNYNDWAIPSIYEMLVLYENLKPTTSQNYKGNTLQSANDPDVPLFDNIYSPQINPYAIPPRWVSYDVDGGPSQTNVASYRIGGPECFSTGVGAYLTTSGFLYFENGMIANGTSNSVLRACTRRVRRIPKNAVIVTGVYEVNNPVYSSVVGMGQDISTLQITYEWSKASTGGAYISVSKSSTYTPPDAGEYRVTAQYTAANGRAVKLANTFTVLAPNNYHGGGAYLGQFFDNNMTYRLIRSIDTAPLSTSWISNVTRTGGDKYGAVYFWNQPITENYTYGYINTYLQSKYPKLNAAAKCISNNATSTFKDWYLPTNSEIFFAQVLSDDTNKGNLKSSVLYTATANYNMYYSQSGVIGGGVKTDNTIQDVFNNNSQFVTSSTTTSFSATANFKYSIKYATVGCDVAGNTWYYDTRSAAAYIPQDDAAYIKAIDDYKIPYHTVIRQERRGHGIFGGHYHVDVKVLAPDWEKINAAMAKIEAAHAAWMATRPNLASTGTTGPSWVRYPWWSSTTFFPFRREIIYNTIGYIREPQPAISTYGVLLDGGYSIRDEANGYRIIISLSTIGKRLFAIGLRSPTISVDKQAATDFCENLSTVANGSSYNDWRLPTTSEMTAIIGKSIEYAVASAAWQPGGLAAIESPAIYWVSDSDTPLLFATDDQIVGVFSAGDVTSTANTLVRVIKTFDYKSSPYPAYARAVR
jgi:hypothetical protein